MPLKLKPGQRWSQSFEKASADGGQLKAKLDHADVLSADNQAWAVLPKREPIPVTLVTEGNLFLQKVFESNPLISLIQIRPDEWSSSDRSHVRQNVGNVDSAHRLATVATSDLTVLHHQIPEVLPGGSVLVIDPRGGCDLWQLGDVLQNSIVNQQDKDSPLLGHVRLDNVVMPEARQLKFTSDEGVKVLARSLAGDPLLATIERPGQKILLLTVNLDEGDLPLRTAFPILMTNALNWFTDNRGDLREALSTGALTEIEMPRQTGGVSPLVDGPAAAPQSTRGLTPPVRLELVAPDGRLSTLPTQSERLTLGPFDQCGVWRIVSAGTAGEEATLLELACNLADRNESDVRVSKSEEATPTSVVSASVLGNRPVWFWLIGLAWLLMAVEWWAYQRRVIS